VQIFTKGVIIINPIDAVTKGIAEGDFVRIESPRSECWVKAHVIEDVKQGILSTTFDFPELIVEKPLTNLQLELLKHFSIRNPC